VKLQSIVVLAGELAHHRVWFFAPTLDESLADGRRETETDKIGCETK
jgi:hypothetical protein